ncbi:MAG: dihydroorotase family protein [Candidatus Dormibacteraeota bacterium]|nr:dihydroorotase family protein [Candidatus Dormibacteraeota bacterium]
MSFDAGIEGGTVVSSQGSRRANVYFSGERIAAVTATREPAGTVFDAAGLLVMPGMIDSHVHLMDPGAPDREDFPCGTAAAARSGVTTVIEHTHGWPVRTRSDFEQKAAHLASRSRVDFALAAHAWPGELDQALEAWRAGAAFLKVFTCTTHGVPAHGPEQLAELFAAGAADGAVCLVHCEDEVLTSVAEQRLRASGREDGGIIAQWRSLEAEVTAVNMVGRLARQAAARVVIAHASSLASIAAAGRVEGGPISIETCPQYLTLMQEEADRLGALRKFTPPARAANLGELDVMWNAVREGRVDIVSSDHAPSTRAHKLDKSIWEAHFGLPGLDTTMGILLDAAASGRISYERLVQVYSETPARLYGLAPKKGALAIGADADVVLVDPHHRWTVTDADILSHAGWSPYSGRELTGRAVRTYVRGRLVMADGEVIAPPGTGALLRGSGKARYS